MKNFIWRYLFSFQHIFFLFLEIHSSYILVYVSNKLLLYCGFKCNGERGRFGLILTGVDTTFRISWSNLESFTITNIYFIFNQHYCWNEKDKNHVKRIKIKHFLRCKVFLKHSTFFCWTWVPEPINVFFSLHISTLHINTYTPPYFKSGFVFSL